MDAIETFLAALERDNPAVDWAAHRERLRGSLRADHPNPGCWLLDIPLRVLPEELTLLPYLRHLNLYGTQLAAVPEWLDRLPQLESLGLGKTPITTLPASLARLAKLADLRLGESALTELPESIGELRHLRHLILASTQLTTLPESIGGLTALEELTLYATQLTTLPESIGGLTSLRKLDLRKTALTTLPASIGALTALEELTLYATPLTMLPESIGGLTSLRKLDVRKTALTKLPSSLGECSELRRLDAWGAPLTGLPESLSQLRFLRELDLSATQITALPAWLGQLPRLSELAVNDTPLRELPATLGDARRLWALDMRATQISALPATFAKLHDLEELDFSATQITALPEWLGQLPRLRHLNLSQTPLRALPAFSSGYSALELLDLRATRITTLPRSLAQLPALKQLDLRETALPLPPELFEHGCSPPEVAEVVVRATTPLNTATLLVAGADAPAKAALLQALGASAAGKSWRLADTSYTLQSWDLAHLELLQPLNQRVLRRRLLPVLVLSGAETAAAVAAWQRRLALLCDQAPLFVYVADSAEAGPRPDGAYAVALATGAGLDALRNSLLGRLEVLCSPTECVPTTWLALKARLERDLTTSITLERYGAWCREAGISAAWEQERLLHLLHELGSVVCFREWAWLYGGTLAQYDAVPSSSVDYDAVWLAGEPPVAIGTILSPHWAIALIEEVLAAPGLAASGGVVSKVQLESLLPAARPALVMLIALLRRLELAVAFADPDRATLLLPAFLPPTAPELGNWADAIGLEYRYAALPDQIIGRLMVELAYLIDPERSWRYGAVFNGLEGTSAALVLADLPSQRIVVQACGPLLTRRRLFWKIRSALRTIHSTYPGLVVEEWVPLSAASALPYTRLLAMERAGLREVQLEADEAAYPIAPLLDARVHPDDRRFEQHPAYAALHALLRTLGRLERLPEEQHHDDMTVIFHQSWLCRDPGHHPQGRFGRNKVMPQLSTLRQAFSDPTDPLALSNALAYAQQAIEYAASTALAAVLADEPALEDRL